MFTKPSRIITVDTLINIKGVSRDLSKRNVVHKIPIKQKEEILITGSPPPNKVNTAILEYVPNIPKVEMSSCYNELSTAGSTIIWVGDR